MISNDEFFKMKNKKNIYFLLPAVLIVWGILIYKVVSGLNPSEQHSQAIEPTGQFTPKSFKKTETFTIKADYRDPFLGTLQKKKTTKTKRKTSPVVEEESIPFPNIIYKGIISPKNKNEKVFLIIVNGQQHLFKSNTTFSEVKLLNGNPKDITVQFQDQKKTFPLAK